MNNQRRSFFKKLIGGAATLGLGAKAIKAENYQKTYEQNSLPESKSGANLFKTRHTSGVFFVTGSYQMPPQQPLDPYKSTTVISG
jgi:hypothetical protein